MLHKTVLLSTVYILRLESRKAKTEMENVSRSHKRVLPNKNRCGRNFGGKINVKNRKIPCIIVQLSENKRPLKLP